jgi:hypothetical protein
MKRFGREKRLTCSQLRTQLPAYFDGELSAARQQAIRDHLAACDDCARYAREAQALEASLFAAADHYRPRLSPQASARVQERVYRRMRRAVLMQPATRFTGRAVALVTLVALVLWTPAGRAVTQAVQKLFWPHTTVQQFPPGHEPEITAEDREWREAQLAAGRAWHLSFEGHNFGGCCSSSGRMRNEAVALSQAIDEAGFDIQLPTFLPDGFVLQEVRLLGVAPYQVFVIYEGTNGRLGFHQSSLGIISKEHTGQNVVTVESLAMSIVTDGTVEEVTIGTTQAALLEGEFLVWEEDGISFNLIGPGLDVETLVLIAESLAPVRQL